MQLEICKLCDNPKVLQRSHVIGRSIFNNLLKKSSGNFGYTTLVKDKEIRKTNDHWALPMLCSSCESSLNSKFENYALWCLKNKQKGVIHRKNINYLQIQNINQYRLIMYIISIFWRAIHSQHRVFKNIDMPYEVEQYLKHCILEKTPLNHRLVCVKIFKLINTSNILSNIPLNGFITNIVQMPKEDDKLTFYTIFEGYYFEIEFYSQIQDNYSLGVLNPRKKILNIPYKELLNIHDLIKHWQQTQKIYNDQSNIMK